jgi:hypothetical protein
MLSISPKNILSLFFFFFIFGAEIQDGFKIQNGAQKRRNLIYAANWPKINEFEKT